MDQREIKIILLTLLSKNVKGVGPAFILKNCTSLSAQNGDVVLILNKILSENNKSVDPGLLEEGVDESSEIVEYCNSTGISIISFLDKEYPNNLKKALNAPPLIFCRGNLDLLHQKSICVIGTRNPNKNGERIASRIMQHYKLNKWNIVNGLALGIDNHSIKDEQGYYQNVIGVLAGGLDFDISKTIIESTKTEAENVLESGGLLISEYPPGRREDTFSTIASCKLQAQISDGLILVQSGINGGSKYTLEEFCKYERPVAVINPVGGDKALEGYSANTQIVEDGLGGLLEFSMLKEKKFHTRTLTVLSSKEDYGSFDQSVRESGQESNTLF